MWKRLSLRARIFLLLTALVLTTLAGGLVTIWHTDAIDSLLTSLIDKNVASFQAAEGLETALLMQKGYLTYYFLDGNPEWLEKLNSHQQTFIESLEEAKKSAYTSTMTDLLSHIETLYHRYAASRDKVVRLYQDGQREAGMARHWQTRQQFLEIFQLCERYKWIHEQRIAEARVESRSQARMINTLTLGALPAVAMLGLWLGYILIKQILEPIRALAQTPGDRNLPRGTDEVQALSQRVHLLMDNIDLAQSQLEKSQEHLLQSEKLALVGKLAAGVAHSIRNPLTSVKMRLYSMRRTLDLSQSQMEDLQVISDEIRHIDAIVRNFLEFSRPPKLKMQAVSPSEVVDQTLQLLRPRFESYNVALDLQRPTPLPEILADPDQLKEVLVNLLVNACEAMVGGGTITIREEENFEESLGRLVRLKISDTGPGIPPALQEKIFQPFFSTKEEGTGLGLPIAARIIGEHGGWLTVDSPAGQGAAFTIQLPFRKVKNGYHPDS